VATTRAADLEELDGGVGSAASAPRRRAAAGDRGNRSIREMRVTSPPLIGATSNSRLQSGRDWTPPSDP
jgi:hypothetical protein